MSQTSFLDRDTGLLTPFDCFQLGKFKAAVGEPTTQNDVRYEAITELRGRAQNDLITAYRFVSSGIPDTGIST